MPDKVRKGKVGRYVELETDLDEAFRAFCEARGTAVVYEIRRAMRRHMEFPEPLPPAPEPPPPPPLGALPTGGEAEGKKKRGRPRKNP